MKEQNGNTRASVFGIDIGKNVFHVVGVDVRRAACPEGAVPARDFTAVLRSCGTVLIGMESCPGSQWLARKLMALGHQVRIIPAQFVKPYVKSNKNDIIDAEAIAEAVTTAYNALCCRSQP